MPLQACRYENRWQCRNLMLKRDTNQETSVGNPLYLQKINVKQSGFQLITICFRPIPLHKRKQFYGRLMPNVHLLIDPFNL